MPLSNAIVDVQAAGRDYDGSRLDPERRCVWSHGRHRLTLTDDWCLVLADASGCCYSAHVYSPEWRSYRRSYPPIALAPDVLPWLARVVAEARRRADDAASPYSLVDEGDDGR